MKPLATLRAWSKSLVSPWLRTVSVAKRAASCLLIGFVIALSDGLCAPATEQAVVLPDGVRAVWDAAHAWREATPTRERMSLNGLWRWQPARAETDQVPADDWGYFKVPGCWPGITDYMQKDSQRVFAHPSWASTPLGTIHSAWYERQIDIPAPWRDRQVALQLECLNSYAIVFVDGQRAGELRFPGGALDLTSTCHPGETHRLSLLVVALPLKGVALSYADTAAAREVKGSVARRGLCGDAWLVSTPAGPRIGDVQVETSVRRREITFRVALEQLPTNSVCALQAEARDRQGQVMKRFTSRAFGSADVQGGRFQFTEAWLPDKLWDTHTPTNTFALTLSLVDAQGTVLDTTWSRRLGCRELWIDGRDFFLNGTRLHLSAVPLDNAEVSAALATYASARETLQRLQSIGINFVYTHNYGCEPGTHLAFEEILAAADDVGMLVSFSQPHFSQYDWPNPDADRTNGYARHAAAYVRMAQDHPSVVMYSMSHNATGYSDDMNPDLIDGVHAPRDTWALKNAALALRAEAIVRGLDLSRIVYHHASGNLGTMHTSNFYPNFAPIQELSDWFQHWAEEGTKPMFLCEYGAPFTWDWTMYRGWFHGQREFGSAKVPWELCIAEWNAQFVGDRAFLVSEAEKADLRWEATQIKAGNLWHRWDYPVPVGSDRFDECDPIFAAYLTDNWRAYRGWGVSAISPWEYGRFWKRSADADTARKDFAVDWDHLQRPGFSPDYQEHPFERMDMTYKRSDWVATVAGQAVLRNNLPLLAFIAGKPARFTSKDHNLLPGEVVEKQLVLINDSREAVSCDCDWTFGLLRPITGSRRVTVPAGEQVRVPLRFELPAQLQPGKYLLSASARFESGAAQSDRFELQVLPAPKAPKRTGRIALFDPKGETRTLLEDLGVHTEPVDAGADLSAFDILVIGKGALTVAGRAPDLSRVRDGLRVVVFEQTGQVLEKRLGFRVEEYGLRQVFARVPDHPCLDGISPDALRDWRGQSTLLPSRLSYEMRPRYGPTVEWCGLPVTRVWRCGNQGNVASVLIEKPARGDFLPILDGGFSLQFSPLLQYREGKGLVLFCQLDVTGRTEDDPAAARIVENLLAYVADWTPAPVRHAVYAGAPEGKAYLESTGLPVRAFEPDALSPDAVLVLGPGAGRALAANTCRTWQAHGGTTVALALSASDVGALFPESVRMKTGEHIATYFPPPEAGTLLTGVGPADVHNRDPQPFPLVTAGAQILGDGILATIDARTVLCQIAPWTFKHPEQLNHRRTYRRTAFLLARLLANAGVSSPTPLLDLFAKPVVAPAQEKRWLAGLYADVPEEWDDPYRFFRW